MDRFDRNSNWSRMDRFIHHEAEFTRNRLKSRNRSNTSLTNTISFENSSNISFPIECLRRDIECFCCSWMYSSKSNKTSFSFSVFTSDSWMKKRESANGIVLMKWWEISDSFNEIGFERFSQRFYRVSCTHSSNHCYLAIG